MKLLKTLIRLILLLLATVVIAHLFISPAQYAPFVRGQVDVIAHQGGNLEWPDATFLAYEEANRRGVDVLEMDVHLSKDGHLMVMHDERVDRTTNGSGAIRELTLPELEALDAAYWWSYHANDDVAKLHVPADMEFPYRGMGLKIPTLREMFERYPNHRFVIELKDNTADLRAALLDLIGEYDRWDRTLIASFYKETLQAVRKEAPNAQTYGAEDEIRLFYILHLAHLERFYPYDIDAFAIPMTSGGFDLTTPRFIQAARNHGLLLHYWTINDDADMQKLLDLGVDGIMTDRPKRLIELR